MKKFKKSIFLLSSLMMLSVGVGFMSVYSNDPVTASAEGGIWSLVDNVSDLSVDDKVVIAASDYDFALSTTQNNNNRGSIEITKKDNKIEINDSTQQLTLGKGTTDTTYSFYTGSGYLCAASSSSNYLRTEADLSGNSSWSITIAANGVATIKSISSYTRNLLKFNNSNNPKIFSCYASGQTDICLYKLEESVSPDSKKYSYNFDANGGTIGESDKYTIDNLAEGTEVELPVATYDGCQFDGWFTDKTGGTKIESLKAGDYNTLTTFYAHWSLIDSGEEGETTTVSVDFSKKDYTNALAISEVVIDGNVTFVANQGTNTNNSPKYYTSGSAIRFYDGNYFTISSKSTIKEIDFTFGEDDGSGTIAPDSGLYDSTTGTWKGSSSSVKFTISDAQRRIQKISVKYLGEAVAVDEATITFNAGEFGSLSDNVVETTNLTYKLPELEKIDQNKIFKGWYDSSDDSFVGLPGDLFTFESGKEYILYAAYDDKSLFVAGTDIIDRSFTSVTGTSYAEWKDKVGSTGVIYSGQSAGGNSSVQLRATSPSGIITTSSGGFARKIVVVWNSNTASGRTLEVYGKGTAYESSSDLYNDSKKGTLIGSIVYGTSTELVIDDDYEFIGFKSKSNSMYLTSISVTWAEKTVSSEFNVELDANGGKFADEVVTTYPGTINEGCSVTLPDTDEVYHPYSDYGVTGELTGWTDGNNVYVPGTTVKFTSKTTLKAVYTYTDSTVTVAQSLEICKLTGEVNTSFNLTVTGKIESIDTNEEYSTQYNNITVNISDETGTIKAYRLIGGETLKVGDVIAVTGKVVNFKSNTPEFVQGCTYTLQSEYTKVSYQYDMDNTPNAVRFISTINLDAEEIESISYRFNKKGVAVDVEIERVYTSIKGQTQFAEVDGTCYAVYSISGLEDVIGETFEVTLTVKLVDETTYVASRSFTLGE